MAIRLGTVPIYVKDQAEALRFYVDALGFEKRMDSPMGEGLRWLTVAPPGEATDFVLASGFGGDDWEARNRAQPWLRPSHRRHRRNVQDLTRPRCSVHGGADARGVGGDAGTFQ